MQLAQQQWFTALRKWGLWIVFAVSLLLTVLNWSNVNQLVDRLSEAPVWVALCVATEIVFTVGLIMMAVAAGKGVRPAVIGRHPLSIIQGWRATLSEIAREAASSRLGWAGFYINFAGSLAIGLVYLSGVLILPPSAWLLALYVAGVDLVATFGRCLPMRQGMRAADTRVRIRLAVPGDLEAYLGLQQESWGEDMAAGKAQLESRFSHCLGWIFVATQGDEVIAAVTTICIDDYNVDHPPSWDAVTANGFCTNHNPNGRVMYGVDASGKAGQSGVIDRILEEACIPLVIRKGLRCGVLGGRLPGYHKYADQMSAEEYLNKKRSDGRPFDAQVRMYGAVWRLAILGVIENYFDDPESLNWGVLLYWDNPAKRLPRFLWRPAARIALWAMAIDPIISRSLKKFRHLFR